MRYLLGRKAAGAQEQYPAKAMRRSFEKCMVMGILGKSLACFFEMCWFLVFFRLCGWGLVKWRGFDRRFLVIARSANAQIYIPCASFQSVMPSLSFPCIDKLLRFLS